MSKLQAALAWAARGFRVFPLQAGGKEPIAAGWTETATSDPAAIVSAWRDPVLGIERDYNIGVLTTGRVVLDVDMKHGHQGVGAMLGLGLDFDTLTVRTPSGGYHLYYDGPNSSGTVGRLGDGLDIRSSNNYVIAPGSTLPDGAYTIEIDAPVVHVPAAIGIKLVAPRTRTQRISSVDLDTPEGIAHAEHYLDREAPTAIEGVAGDDTTYRVCCRLRDYGVSEDVALELLLDRWNARCSPPWSRSELQSKIENAFAYATGEAGSKHPANFFGDVEIPTIPALTVDIIQSGLFVFGNAKPIDSIQARPWIIKNLLLVQEVTAMVAAGAAGKSTMALLLAAHIALGRDFMGMKVARPGKSIVYNAEDNIQEMSRRLWAICCEYNFDFEAVKAQIALVDYDTLPIQVVQGSPPRLHEPHVRALIEAAIDPEVVMVALDPLVNLHDVPEDDNVQMRYVMDTLRLIARTANVGLFLAHHTRKPSSTAIAAGDVNMSRGAGSITNSARVALTLVNATRQDQERYGIPDHEMKRLVRLDNAKENFSLTDHAMWLKRKGVRAWNGDEIGTLGPADLSNSAADQARYIAGLLAAAMRERGTSSLTMTEAQDVLRKNDAMYGHMEVKHAKAAIERLLAQPVVSAENDTVVHQIDGRSAQVVMS